MYDSNMLGVNLKRLRRERSLTQAALAEMIHISAQNVSKWERGLCLPDLDKLCILARVLGVGTDTLLSSEQPIDTADSYIAVDGGGTKTEFCLFTKQGEVLDRIVLGPTNPNIVGMDAALGLIKSGIDSLLLRHSRPRAIFAGISGCGFIEKNRRILKDYLEKTYPDIKTAADGDIVNVIYSTEYFLDCIVAIMGTGSVVAVNNSDGFNRVGGWGYLFDECFSGFGIGRDAALHALRVKDGFDEGGILSDAVTDALGGDVIASLGLLYSDGNEKICSFAPLVFDAYKKGDAAAQRIIEKRLGELLLSLETARSMYNGGRDVIFTGGLAAQREIISEYLSDFDFRIHFTDLPPIYGAANRCLREVGLPGSDFKENFKKSYYAIRNKGEKDNA